jgi:hypothetical protein
MAQQRTRDGQKEGESGPGRPGQRQPTHRAGPPADDTQKTDRGQKPGRQQKDDESTAPESGDRKATGNQ